jgi:CrcB protein
MLKPFIVFLGSGIGGTLRYLIGMGIGQWVRQPFPLGTVTINVTGSFLIAFIAGLSDRTRWISPEVKLFLTTGIMGGYTTYSSFNYETLVLAQQGEWRLSVLNVAATVVLCLLSGLGGFALARLIAPG